MKKTDTYKQLEELMKTYDRELTTRRNKEFLENFRNLGKELCMPLNEEETYILRSLTGVIETKNKATLAYKYELTIEDFQAKLDMIYNILRLYFYNVFGEQVRYNITVNEFNEEITIFDLGLSEDTLYSLRLCRCYYLKDISKLEEEYLGSLIKNVVDYNKILEAMRTSRMKFDSKVLLLK